MFRRQFLLLSLASGFSACATQSGLSLTPNSTLIVVRHADRAGEDLTSKGIARAKSLVTALEGMPLDAIYSPGIKRNLDTATHLSAARDLPIHRRRAENPTRRLVREGAGKTVIWIGNKGNIRSIWESLGLSDPPIEYGDLHIIRSGPNGETTVEKRHFGPA